MPTTTTSWRGIEEFVGINSRVDAMQAVLFRRAGSAQSQADITLARQLLGYEPQVDFDDGLRQSIDYYRTIAQR